MEKEFVRALESFLRDANERYGYTIVAQVSTVEGSENGTGYLKIVPVISVVKTHEVETVEDATNSNMGGQQ
jgi:hypothetical protein